MTEQSCKTSNMLPYSVILSATAGDVEAVNTVLKHYEKYIITFQPKLCGADNGYDLELTSRLESKLIMQMLTFRV